MEKKEDNTFLYAFLVVVFIFLAGIAFIVTRPSTNEVDFEQEIENPDNNSNNGPGENSQNLNNKFPSEVFNTFSNIIEKEEYKFVSQTSFRSFVENDEETSTKNFSSAVQFIIEDENFKYFVTNREGNSRNEQSFTFESDELFELKAEEDMVLVEDENFVSNLINAKDQIKEPNYFFINENDIQSIKIDEDNGNDLISVELVENGISKLVDQGLAESIKNYFKVDSVIISTGGYEINYVISDESLTREISIGEIDVEIDSTRSFSVRDFKTIVEYAL